MMEVETSSDDFWPFPSKVFALLYLLLNSPRPMVRVLIARINVPVLYYLWL